MSAIDPSNFKSAKQIAQEILDTTLGDDGSPFKRFISECYVEQAPDDKYDADSDVSQDFCKNCDELIGNLEAIAAGKTNSFSLGNHIHEMIETLAQDRERIAQSFHDDIHPEAKGKRGQFEINMRQLSREIAHAEQRTPATDEERNANATDDYYYEKNLAKNIRTTMPPLFKALMTALEREQGKDSPDR